MPTLVVRQSKRGEAISLVRSDLPAASNQLAAAVIRADATRSNHWSDDGTMGRVVSSTSHGLENMLLALASIDYAVLAFYLLVMLGVGVYFSRQQHSSRDFFLAGRSMGWVPVGISIMATLLSALSYSGIPGEGYFVGLKFLALPIAIWLLLPIITGIILPLYHRLGIYSIYEYLEMRYDTATRLLSSVVFVLWRLLWLGGVLYAPCKLLVVAAGIPVPTWWLLIVLGLVSTGYTFLGGIKAVIWTDVIQAAIMASGLVLIIGAVWWQLDGGFQRIFEVNQGLGRTRIVDSTFDWGSKWSIWGILPHFFLASLSFYVADQITVQRYLTTKTVSEAKRSFVLNCVSVTLMVPALTLVGMSLLAFYHDHPGQMKAIWVANVDNRTRQSITDEQGRPLVDWQTDLQDPVVLEQLVAERRLLRPNSKQPFQDTGELLTDGIEGPRIDLGKLAMRSPPREGMQRGEVVMHDRARDELLPHFITNQIRFGLAGLILAALFAASMSSMDSGLNSICTLMVTDFHRRLGWGRAWLARRSQKSVDQLDEIDELRLSRVLVLLIGVAATAFSVVVAQIGNIFDIMIGVVNTFGGPLLAIYLLGTLTRRTTAAAARWTLVLGTLFTIWLTASNHYPGLSGLWPFTQKLHGIWSLPLGVAFSLALGYVVSFFLGEPRGSNELRGLVVGIGELGNREPEEASIAIPDSFDIGDDDG
jgi:Na+/proline symporter